MIKTRINNEYKDVVKIFGGGTLQKEIIKVWSREAQEYVYESSVEYTGSLPITINTNGDALIDYRIYGANGGVGEPTENLIRAVPTTQRVYLANEKYCLSKYVTAPTTGNKVSIVVYDANDVIIFNDYIGIWRSLTYDNTSGQGAYADITISFSYGEVKASFVVGESDSTAVPYPASYIPYGYKLPMTVQSENLFDKNATNTENGFIASAYINYQNTVTSYYSYNVSEYIPIKPNTDYYAQNISYERVISCALCFYTSSYEFISGVSYNYKISIPFKTPANAAYVRMSVKISNLNIITLIEGTEPPSEYIPYNKSTYPVYIGDTPLDEGEYVSYSEQKIYRDVNGTLTPTDPPVPLPDIPTIKGETIIDYDGEPKPSQVYVKYRR